MAFPLNPDNGQQATVNGLIYVYNSTIGAWTIATQAQSIDLTVASIGASGNVTGSSGVFTNVSGAAHALTAINASNIASGTLSSDRLSGTYTITVSGAATTAATVTTAAQPNITSVGTLTALNVNGNVAAYHVNPVTNNTYDLGTSAARWRNIYTQDLHLNNGIGDWTIVEGEDDLFLYNNKRDKVYKFNLTEIDPEQATPKINELNKKS
jgi:hypothetical protein